MKKPVIYAPHCDDEIIGCFELLKFEPIIIYDSENMDAIRKSEAETLKKYYEVSQIFTEKYVFEGFEDHQIYIPDPIYELHPKHRQLGQIGESLARAGYNIIFYNTNMNAPYIHECIDPVGKRELLNLVYPSQEELWKYDHKYFLFEGRCKWVF
jgi:hypothetical protein